MAIIRLIQHSSLTPSANIGRARALLTVGTLLCTGAIPGFAQNAPSLANVAQNPVASVISLPFQGFYNVKHPDNGAEWSTRVGLQFLFQK
jgi:hypothetical protein